MRVNKLLNKLSALITRSALTDKRNDCLAGKAELSPAEYEIEKPDDEENDKIEVHELARFFTVSLDMLSIMDRGGKFIKINRAWERTMGYSFGEIGERNILEITHPDDVEVTAKTLAALADQVPVNSFVNRCRTSGGDYRSIEWSAYPSGLFIYCSARDISERIKYEHDLNRLAERLTLATGSAGIGIWDWDADKNVLEWDYRMYELHGLSKDGATNPVEVWRKNIHKDDRNWIDDIFTEKKKELELSRSDFRVVWPDGSVHNLEGNALVIRDAGSGRVIRGTGAVRDVTERKRMEESLMAMSTVDPLTSVFNRRYMTFMIDSEISRAKRYGTGFSLIMFDIDYFKKINDNFGHDAGDDILKALTGMVIKRIRNNDILARWGGEEFLILLPGTEKHNAELLAEKLALEIRRSSFGKPGRVTASFGVAEYEMDELSESVLKRVDGNLYRAKKEGRDCVRS